MVFTTTEAKHVMYICKAGPMNASDGGTEIKIPCRDTMIVEYIWVEKTVGGGDNDDLRYNFKEIELLKSSFSKRNGNYSFFEVGYIQ